MMAGRKKNGSRPQGKQLVRGKVKTRWIVAGVLILAGVAIAAVASAGQGSPPPPRLRALERQVALRIADARTKGPSEPRDLKRLLTAERVENEAEREISVGEYRTAETELLRAEVIVSQIGH